MSLNLTALLAFCARILTDLTMSRRLTGVHISAGLKEDTEAPAYVI